MAHRQGRWPGSRGNTFGDRIITVTRSTERIGNVGRWGEGAEEVAVPLACGLHPEFGYVGSPGLRRRLGRGLAFAVFGLLAAAGGVGVFMADPDPDPDPMHAMALAPV